jgi:hypothetical protein
MSIIDWLVVLIYLVLVAVGKVGVSAVTLVFLVLALIVEKIVIDRYPFWTRPAP